jgi:hypothetical protein
MLHGTTTRSKDESAYLREVRPRESRYRDQVIRTNSEAFQSELPFDISDGTEEDCDRTHSLVMTAWRLPEWDDQDVTW